MIAAAASSALSKLCQEFFLSIKINGKATNYEVEKFVRMRVMSFFLQEVFISGFYHPQEGSSS